MIQTIILSLLLCSAALYGCLFPPFSPPRGIICMGQTCNHQWCVNIPRHPWTLSYHFFDTTCEKYTWHVNIPFKNIYVSGKNGDCVTVDLYAQNFSSPFKYCEGIACVHIDRFISVRGFCED